MGGADVKQDLDARLYLSLWAQQCNSKQVQVVICNCHDDTGSFPAAANSDHVKYSPNNVVMTIVIAFDK